MHRLIGAGGLLLAGAGIMTVLLWSPLGAAADGTDRGSPAGGAPGHPFPSSPIVYQQEQTGFTDVDPDSTHAANIDAIAAAGITQSCATDPLRYCPDRPVTRAQTATFLTRALDLPAPDQPAGISDEVPQAPSISTPIEPAPSSNEAADAEEQPTNEGTSTEKQSANQAADTDGQAPTQAKAPPATGFKAVSAGWEHTCGVRTDTTITCWGYNHSGLGEPPAVAGFEDVSAGVGHTCGIRTDRSIVCWGNNYGGQANPPAGAFSAVSVGQGHSCGRRSRH